MYRKIYKKLIPVNETIIKIEMGVSFAVYAILIFSLIYQVFTRFVLKSPASWTEEVARYSFVVVMYLACGFTLHYGKHVEMNLIDEYLAKTKNPKRSFFIAQKVNMAANILFCSFFIYLYYPFLMKIRANGKTAVTVDIPVWVIMSAVLVGIILMMWHSLFLLLQPYEEDKPAELTSPAKKEAKA